MNSRYPPYKRLGFNLDFLSTNKCITDLNSHFLVVGGGDCSYVVSE